MLLNPVQTDAVEEFLRYDTGTWLSYEIYGRMGSERSTVRDCSEYSRATRTVVRAATLAVVVAVGLALV